jgi:predicted glycoside hydrolase/deacetylase ChbG (UPF0249 family)
MSANTTQPDVCHHGRRLIVNADDFGLSLGVNAGIIRAHERGIVTATSLMVRWPAADAAAAYARSHSQLDVGLHIDLGESIYRNGNWEMLYEVVAPDDASAVAAEVDRQLAIFRGLLGRDPSHIDSHQHVHRDEPARSIIAAVAHRLRVPLRHFTPGFQYWGQFYGQSDTGESYPELIGVEALIALLGSLPDGVTELGCHPASIHDTNSMYGTERIGELQSLCDDRIRAAVAIGQIELSNFTTYVFDSNPTQRQPVACGLRLGNQSAPEVRGS